MGLLDRVQEERLAVRSAGPMVQKDIWGPTWQAFNGMSTDEGGIQEVQDQPSDYSRARTAESYVFTCEQVRAKAISQVPLKTWQTTRDGKRKEVEHDALGVLQETNPVGYVDGSALLRYTLVTQDMHGRCYWRVVPNRKGQPAEVYWQIPTQVSPLPDPVKFFWGIRVIDQNGVRDVPAEELCWFVTDNMENPLLGTSKIKVLRSAINLRQYSARSNIDFFKNSQRPDWILSGNWANTEENMARLRREVRRHLTGANNRAPLFLGEGATAHLLTMSHEDAQWLEQQRLSQEEISSTFGVPLIYLNNLDRATYENIKVAKLILWHDTMIPEGDIMAEMLNRRFLWRFWPETKSQKIEFGFDYDEIEGLGEDLALIWERVINMSKQLSEQVKNRELTPNQARLVRNQLFSDLGIDVAGFNGDIPGGDMFFEQFSYIPVNELSTQTTMNIWAMRGNNPEFVEDVPGAPTAGENADAVLDRLESQKPPPNLPQLPPGVPTPPAQQAPAQQPPQAGKAASLVRKGPHPHPIRAARLKPVQDRLVGKLKKHFGGLQRTALRKLRGQQDGPKAYVDPDGEEASFVRGQRFPLRLKQDPLDPDQQLYDSQQAQQDLADIIREAVASSGAAAYGAAAEDYALKVAWNEGNPWLQKYMGMRLPLVNGIDDNLRQRLRQALLDSAEAGDSIADITSAVRDVFQSQIDNQAEVIARTETIQAYGSASLAAYGDAGVTQAQMYDGDNDDSADCAQVNGMIVTLDEAERLMGEEHPNGTRGVAPIVPEPGTLAIAASAPATIIPIRKEILYATGRRPAEHDHSTAAGERPVIVLDLHGTLTPSNGFTAPGRPGAMLPPFPGVKAALDMLVAGGCCLHLATAALSPQHPPDILIARRKLIDGYNTEYGLPISFVTGKVGAHVYYDDRMVPARGRSWPDILGETVQRLGKRFLLGPDGIWRRRDIPDVGHDYEQPQPEDIAPDQPRGLSTNVLDVDLHRCLFQASSSKLEAGLKPGALAALRVLYPLYTINLSCAGWDPSTHDPADSAQRIAAMRQQVRQLGVPYDEMVSKDHPDLAIDDKGIRHVDWVTDLPILMARLAEPHPEDEVTRTESGATANSA